MGPAGRQPHAGANPILDCLESQFGSRGAAAVRRASAVGGHRHGQHAGAARHKPCSGAVYGVYAVCTAAASVFAVDATAAYGFAVAAAVVAGCGRAYISSAPVVAAKLVPRVGCFPAVVSIQWVAQWHAVPWRLVATP